MLDSEVQIICQTRVSVPVACRWQPERRILSAWNESSASARGAASFSRASEIYGGLNGVWDYGPLGVELKRNLKDYWWRVMVRERDDVVGMDGAILTHRAVLKASGHEDTFSDPMVDCRTCKARLRADQLPEKNGVKQCPNCGGKDLTEARPFNLMFSTQMGASADPDSIAYLRPGDRAIDLRPVQECPRYRAQKAALRHRANREGVPERDQPAQLHLSLARV